MNWALDHIPFDDLVLFERIADDTFGPRRFPMRFSSQWQTTSQEIDLSPEKGTHSPPWDELDEDTQAVIESAAGGLEQTVSDLAELRGKKQDVELEYQVSVSGYAAEGPEDSTQSFVSTAINEGQGTWES